MREEGRGPGWEVGRARTAFEGVGMPFSPGSGFRPGWLRSAPFGDEPRARQGGALRVTLASARVLLTGVLILANLNSSQRAAERWAGVEKVPEIGQEGAV